MQLNFDPTTTHHFNRATRYEWLETNGLGGYASSTIIGTNTRRYHGLLVAALQPPVGRTLLLSKLDESIEFNGHRRELGTNKYHGTVFPNGYIFQEAFEQDIFPTFYYDTHDIKIKKTIVALHGENTTMVLYEVQKAPGSFQMNLLPLTANRNFHYLEQARELSGQQTYFDEDVLRFRFDEEASPLFISVPGSDFTAQPDWYYGMEYAQEQFRGMDAHEDLFSPGKFTVNMEEGTKLGIIISIDDPVGRDPWQLMDQERARRQELVERSGFKGAMMQQLVRSADQFIVQRDESLKSIIAGYPWFSDWGRDTMIALPGLCLATGREEDAGEILEAFAKYIDQGMIPNRFPDEGQAPVYNTIDATLWFFVALFKYFKHTKASTSTLKYFLPAMQEILDWHQKGTRYNIHMDEDLLLTGGSEGVQLTWMDAIVDGWVVTPRIGKAVEINALWYNAWEIFAWTLQKCQRKEEAEAAHKMSRSIRRSFLKTFWNPELECLHDLVHQRQIDASIRPNQLFAISLPFSLLSKNKAQKVLTRVERELFTPVGMRSLSFKDSAYEPHYGGDQYQRDKAYHQGTVWGWLLGPYLDTVIKVRGTLGKAQAKSLILGLKDQLRLNGVGTLSEIYEGASPWEARGCYAQAWSVSEILRIAAEYKLFRYQEAALPASFLELQQRDLFS
jgi:predicted glycogen debranching enzyme